MSILTEKINNYISVNVILEKIIRDCNINATDEFNINWFIEWILEAEENIGSTTQLIKKNATIIVKNKLAIFPCDVYKIIMLSLANNGVGLLQDTSHFPKTFNNNTISNRDNLSYVLNDTNINIDLADNTGINISYYAIPVDDEGIPLIKNSIHHKEAIVAYCVMQWYYRDYLDNKIQPSVWKEREMNWFVKRDKASTKDMMPSLAQRENIGRLWLRLLPQTDSYYHSFMNRGNNTGFHVNG